VVVRRRIAAVIVVVVLVAVGFAVTRGGKSSTGKGSATRTGSKSPAAAVALVFHVGPASWHLPAPLSRAVALPASDKIRLLGGLGPANKTSPAVVDFDPATGQPTPVGSLANAVHDAAGAVLRGNDVVFGGGASTVVAGVQAAADRAGAAVASVGALPAPRADLAAATVGAEAVVVGGYDGTNFSPDVLTTADGVSFQVLTQLPQPVRYPAVVAIGQRVFVVGGELAGNGGDSSAIQVIDMAARTAKIAAQLPTGLSHAGAAVIGGTIYLFGGRSAGHVVDDVSALDPATLTVKTVAALPVALSDMAVTTMGPTTYLIGGEDGNGHPVAAVAVASQAPPSSTSAASAATAAAPFNGQLLIADRGNNRLVLVDTAKNVAWRFPSPTAPTPAEGFYFPDDAFFAKHGTAIITNQEDQNTIIEIAYPSGAVIASYGHAGKAGSTVGYLSQPDDAYLLADGRVTVADAMNCRLVFLNPDFTYQGEIGTDHRCVHNPPTDLGYPNGDTPLADGNILVSEIHGSYVDELRPDGTAVWSVKLPVAYPSDPQQIGPDLYLMADYSHPGGLYEFTRDGTIMWNYTFPSGEPMLDHPSLAEVLPNGLICVNDDYRHRVVIIDPVTKTIVWQYGQTGLPGTGPNQLNTPDGFDILAPDGTTPTHPQTG
jgi:outer membrane protein assembly factor BamB